jgi:hypothetical protein
LSQQIDAPSYGGPQNAFVAYELSEMPSLPLKESAAINFGDTITLLGYEITPTASGSTLPVTLFWRVNNLATANYTPFLQLEDAWGHRWSQAETFAYPAEQWEPGETIIQQVQLPVPPGTPPGKYRLRGGLFDPDTAQRIPRLDQAGSFAGDAFFIEDVEIKAGDVPETLPDPPFVVDELLLPGLRLLGYERGGASAMSGAPWGLSLWWLATEPLPPLNTALELVDGAGELFTLLEGQPVHDTVPFVDWQPPQFVIDHRSIPIPLNFRSGDYRLRLRLAELNGDDIGAVDLGLLAIEKSDRLFIAPLLENKLDATFGNEIALLGYDISSSDDGTYNLRLAWQALQEPSASYTVFVHVLNQDGSCCIWQQDAMPQQNQHPTSRWLPGEVVVDTYEIALPADLPAGQYPIESGLYVAETGQRLTVRLPGQPEGDLVLLRPLTVP